MLSIEASITFGAPVFLPVKGIPIDDPEDDEEDVAVELELLVLEVEDNGDEGGISMRNSYSILIVGASVLKLSMLQTCVLIGMSGLLCFGQLLQCVTNCINNFVWISMQQNTLYVKVCMQTMYKRTPSFVICLHTPFFASQTFVTIYGCIHRVKK